MIFWNYYLCVATDPGHVPSGWVRINTSIPRLSLIGEFRSSALIQPRSKPLK
jgi:hypothetical protein